MVDPQYWGVFEYGILVILAVYAIRGFFRNTAKSVLSFILLPLTLAGYLATALLLGRRYMIPVNLLGVFKLLFIAFVFVTLARWLLYFVIGTFLAPGNPPKGFFTKMVRRFPGALVSFAEGACFVVVILWGMDYFDSLLENRFERLYRDAYRNPFFETVNRANPIYDIEGAKSLKIVSSVLSRSVWVDRLAEKPVYRRFLELPALRKMMNDQEFQRIVREKNTREMIFHPLVLRFLKDSEVFEILTSSEFIRSCRSVLPATQVEMIESREGAFSDLNLDLSSLTSRDVEAESTEPAFEPDTRVRLKNGFVFEGVLVHYDDRGLRLKLEEGEFTIKTAEIESVRRIKENQ